MSQHFSERLARLGACSAAVEYARGFRSLSAAWAACERADWMLWLAGKLSGEPGSKSRKKVVAAAVDCAATARQSTSGDVRRVFDTCQRTTQRYLGGRATLEEVLAAAAAANAAAYDAYAAAYAAANAAAYAAYAAADEAAAKAAALKRVSDIVRRHYPTPPRLPR